MPEPGAGGVSPQVIEALKDFATLNGITSDRARTAMHELAEAMLGSGWRSGLPKPTLFIIEEMP